MPAQAAVGEHPVDGSSRALLRAQGDGRVAGRLMVGLQQDQEQRGGVDGAVVTAVGNLPEMCQFAVAGLKDDAPGCSPLTGSWWRPWVAERALKSGRGRLRTVGEQEGGRQQRVTDEQCEEPGDAGGRDVDLLVVDSGDGDGQQVDVREASLAGAVERVVRARRALRRSWNGRCSGVRQPVRQGADAQVQVGFAVGGEVEMPAEGCGRCRPCNPGETSWSSGKGSQVTTVRGCQPGRR